MRTVNVRCDTVDIVLPRSICRIKKEHEHNPDKYLPIPKVTIGAELYFMGKRFIEKHKGLNFISEQSNGIHFRFSHPNFMGLDPRNLGDRTNFDAALDKIREIGGLDFKMRDAYEKGYFCNLHCVSDPYLGSMKNVDKKIAMLRVLEPNNYRCQPHNNNAKKGGFSGKGFVFKRDVKNNDKNQHGIKFYNKGAEFSSNNPEGYKKMKEIGEWGKIDGILRVEAELLTFNTIRSKTGAKDNTIWNVLRGKFNPVDKIFNEIIINSKLVKSLSEKNHERNGFILPNVHKIIEENMTMKEFKDSMNAMVLIETFGASEESIKSFLSGKYDRRIVFREMKRLRPYIQKERRAKFKLEKGYCWTLEELKNLQEQIKRA